MKSSRRYVVRVVTDDNNKAWFDNPFLECLRHAGAVKVHREGCFDLLPPAEMPVRNFRPWAEREAERMRSFGLNAVAAPEWADE